MTTLPNATRELQGGRNIRGRVRKAWRRIARKRERAQVRRELHAALVGGW